VQDYCGGDTAAIWVTHDPAQVRRVGTRHLVMDQGRVV
jgi:ABC-type sulfate/molybdate transport systems ATPase subunit